MRNSEFVKYQNPFDYLKVFFRRKWLLIAPLFAGLVISVIAAFTLAPTYESSTIILVEEEKIINPLIHGLAVSTSVVQRMRTLKEQILSWDSLVKLTKQLSLDKNIETQSQFEDLIARLRRNIQVQLRGPTLIKLSYQDKEPGQAQLVTKTITDIFIDENMRSQTKETDVAINFIKEQLEVYKRKIKESEIAKMEDDLKVLLRDSTEQHPIVKELRQKLEIARREMDSGEFKVADANSPANGALYEGLRKELDRIINTGEVPDYAASSLPDGASPSDPGSAVYKLFLMDKVGTALARDMSVNENIYNVLLQKLETAKITQRLEASKQGTRYTIIDPPRLPLKPAKPNKMLVVFLGIFLGGMTGAGMVLAREFMDQSFLDIEDAKHNLELPVLGAISRLTTQDEIIREKSRQRKLVFSASAASIVFILASMLVSVLRK